MCVCVFGCLSHLSFAAAAASKKTKIAQKPNQRAVGRKNRVQMVFANKQKEEEKF